MHNAVYVDTVTEVNRFSSVIYWPGCGLARYFAGVRVQQQPTNTIVVCIVDAPAFPYGIGGSLELDSVLVFYRVCRLRRLIAIF